MSSESHPLASWVPEKIRTQLASADWDHQGMWKAELPFSQLGVDELAWHLSLPFWAQNDQPFSLTPMQVKHNPRAHKQQWQRTMDTDLACPLMALEGEGRLLVLDGIHRLLKAYSFGHYHVPVKAFAAEKITDYLN